MASCNHQKADAATGVRPRVMRISWSALRTIIDTVGRRPAESGALLCGPEGGEHISQAHFDTGTYANGAAWSPNVASLNAKLKSLNASLIRMYGFVHSHPVSITSTSGADADYAARILGAIPDMPYMWMPIVISAADAGCFELHPYVAMRTRGDSVSVHACSVQVLDLPAYDSLEIAGVNVLQALLKSGTDQHAILRIGERHSSRTFTSPRGVGTEKPAKPVQPHTANNNPDEGPVQWSREGGYLGWMSAPARTSFAPTTPPATSTPSRNSSSNHGKTFDRVQKAYDLPLMANSRFIVVGTGGGASWVEDAGRAGVGQFVLIDHDIVSETNLATQQTYRRDIGRAKVECLAERLRDINPNVVVETIQSKLEDLSDARLRDLALGAIQGRSAQRTVICGLTDSFAAQARVNRLALKLGIPSLCAQMYQEGRGGEVTFTYPGITAACHRCILSSRYRHFVDELRSNEVTSHGSPIFSAMRLNALAGWVLLAILHHGSTHPRWGGLLQRIGKRNLIQLRMDPDIATSLGLTAFDKASGGQPRHLFDDALWLPQEAEAPPQYLYHCPDCGGLGDLSKVPATCGDTQTLSLAQPLFVLSTGYAVNEVA